jgi:hypothetical protein
MSSANLAWFRYFEVMGARIANWAISRDLAHLIICLAASHARLVMLTFAANGSRVILGESGEVAASRTLQPFEEPRITTDAETMAFVDAMDIINMPAALVAFLKSLFGLVNGVHAEPSSSVAVLPTSA